MDNFAFELKDSYDFSDLLKLMAFLRSPAGCPWDRKQSLASLQQYLLEESNEAVDAFFEGDAAAHAAELGDVLLQVVFQAQVAKEEATFDINAIINQLIKKLVRRHSHIFGADNALNAEAVKLLWKKNKEQEGVKSGKKDPFVEIKSDQASLHRSWAIQKEAAKFGFDWPDYQGAAEKVKEELTEVIAAVEAAEAMPEEQAGMGNKQLDTVAEECGDLIFAVVNLLRKLDVHAETALAFANAKFIKRFRMMSELAESRDIDFSSLSLEQQDLLWEEIK